MATTHHNISTESTQELLATGDSFKLTSISLTNIHASATCTVDLYIEKKLTGRFYVVKAIALPVGTTLILEGNDIKLNNTAGEFSLYIKLTKSASETPVVDVIIS